MRYALKWSDKIEKPLEALRLSKLEGTGAVVRVRTKNSLYRIDFRKDGTVISGGKISKKPVPVEIYGMGSYCSSGLATDCIYRYGRLESNLCRTSIVLSVVIEAPKAIIKKALFFWGEG